MQGMEIFYGKGMPQGQLTDRDLDKMASDAPGMVKFYQNMHHPEQKDYWRTFLKGVWPMWTTPTSLAEEEVKKSTLLCYYWTATGMNFSPLKR